MFNRRNKKERAIESQISSVHAESAYRNMPLDVFGQEVRKLAADNDGAIDFDDRFYLNANPDVKRAVQAGDYLCGYVHYCLHGQHEPRLWSTRHLMREFGVPPQVGQGLFEPVNFHAPVTYGPDLSALRLAAKPTLLVLLPNLQHDLFFAGYSGFFADMKSVFPLFARILVVVVSPEFEPELARSFDQRIEVLHLSKLCELTEKPSVIFHYDAETFYIARDIFNALDRTIYYCQDFEAGFHPFGTYYVRAEQAVANSQNIVLSTGLLRDFLARRDFLSGANIHVTSPSIKAVKVEPIKKKRLFFYFRPERFNTRNMPELVMAAVEAFCRKYIGYEIFLCGAVKTSYSIRLNGTDISVLSKLSKEKYEALLASCDAVVALIYSAHPGVIAFQAAASGIPTVTNTFETRDASVLRQISKNIVPFDPLRNDLLDKLEVAIQMPKGQPSFNAEFYEGRTSESFSQYVTGVMQAACQSKRSGTEPWK